MKPQFIIIAILIMIKVIGVASHARADSSYKDYFDSPAFKEQSEKEYRETVRKRQGFSKIKFKEKYRETPIRSYNKSFFLKNNKLNNIVKSVKIYPIPKCALDGKFAFCLMIEKK